jgi:hypothetical protein
MKHNRPILTLFAVGGLFAGLFLAQRSDFAGYMLVAMFGVEYYSKWEYAQSGLENERNLPPFFHLRLVDSHDRYGTVIPCLSFYSLEQNKSVA